jgi:hypothetical protein
MSKLGAIARYELLMAWRRRSLPILWVLLLVGVVGFGLLVKNVNQQTPVTQESVERTAALEDAPEWARGLDVVVTTNTIALINVLIAGMIFYTIGITLMMGEVIPLDRQFRVRELLDTLPISRAQYLGGKLLGAWAGLLAGTVVAGAVCAVAIRLIFGVYDLRVFAALWFAMLVPLCLLAAALSVLASAQVGSRRTAVMIGLLVTPVMMVLATASVISFAGIGALIQPVYAVGVLMMPGDETNAEIVSRIGTALLLFTGIGAAMWTLVWGWSRVRDAR